MMFKFTRHFSFLLIALFLSLSSEGASGIFQTYVFYNDGASQLRNGAIHNGSNGANNPFAGTTFTNPTTLNLTGAEIHTFKNGGSDVTGGQFYYRVYEQGTAAPSYSMFTIGFRENCDTGAGNFSNSGGGQCGDSNDQKWQNIGVNIDLLAGITMNGTYNIDVYWEAFSTDGTHEDGNAGAPRTATIVVTNIMPVVLTKFTSIAKSEHVNLNWQTTSELNNSHFEIQHSTNSKTWKTIDKVIGAGTTDDIKNYDYTHKSPAPSMNYYRLKQVDYDGAFEYSSIVSVDISKGELMNIFPNPVTDNMSINFKGMQIKNTPVSVYTISGKLVHQTLWNDNTSTMELDVHTLETGMYFIQINTKEEQYTQRFIKR